MHLDRRRGLRRRLILSKLWRCARCGRTGCNYYSDADASWGNLEPPFTFAGRQICRRCFAGKPRSIEKLPLQLFWTAWLNEDLKQIAEGNEPTGMWQDRDVLEDFTSLARSIERDEYVNALVRGAFYPWGDPRSAPRWERIERALEGYQWSRHKFRIGWGARNDGWVHFREDD